ncbi:MAG: Fur family transcriptional regulator [Planctomycetota bacterium]|jgi:Fur family ferric uptake transcriptional regulator
MPRSTRQRDAIEGALAGAGRPLSPKEVLDAARFAVPTLGMATVYRNLARLLEDGAIVPVNLPGEVARYELRCAAENHHHHFRCNRCDAVFDVDGCPRNLAALVPDGFELLDHDIVLYGLCAGCVKRHAG